MEMNLSFLTPQKIKKNSDEFLNSYLSPPPTTHSYNTSSAKSDQENTHPFTQNLFSKSHEKQENKPQQQYSSQFSYITPPASYKKSETDRFIPLRQNNSISRNLFSLTNKDLDIQAENLNQTFNKNSAQKPKKMSATDNDLGID